MTTRDRLRVAVQKSGRLADASRALLARCGLAFRQGRDKLFCFGESLPIDLLLVRDDDIPRLIAEGVCDLGIVGRNVLREHALATATGGDGASFAELRALGFGRCRLAIAAPTDAETTVISQLGGLRIATSYPNLLAEWLRAQGLEASVVVLSGSVEIAPRLGSADVVCDLVSSGATLAANQLREIATLLESEAVLAASAVRPVDERAELIELLLRRIDGSLAVRETKLVMFHAPRAALARIASVLPDAQSPIVTSIDGSDDVSTQTLCHGAVTWQHLEDMKRAGARSLLVLPVEKMLA